MRNTVDGNTVDRIIKTNIVGAQLTYINPYFSGFWIAVPTKLWGTTPALERAWSPESKYLRLHSGTVSSPDPVNCPGIVFSSLARPLITGLVELVGEIEVDFSPLLWLLPELEAWGILSIGIIKTDIVEAQLTCKSLLFRIWDCCTNQALRGNTSFGEGVVSRIKVFAILRVMLLWSRKTNITYEHTCSLLRAGIAPGIPYFSNNFFSAGFNFYTNIEYQWSRSSLGQRESTTLTLISTLLRLKGSIWINGTNTASGHGEGEDGGEPQPSSLLISEVSTTVSEVKIKYSTPRSWRVTAELN